MIVKIEKLLVLNYKWFNFDKKIMLLLVCSQRENPIWIVYDASNDRHMKRYIWIKEVICNIAPVRYGVRKKPNSKKNRNAYSIEVLKYETYVNTIWSKKVELDEWKELSKLELYTMLNGEGVI